MNITLIFFIKNFNIKQYISIDITAGNELTLCCLRPQIGLGIFTNFKKTFLKRSFLKRSVTSLKIYKFVKNAAKVNFMFFINRFLVGFLENFLKSKVLFNIKKGSNKIILKQISKRKFSLKYFKKHLKTSKQIIGVLYYSFLLKDASIFVNFIKKILEKLNLKLHKKMFLGIKKLIKDLFKPVFNFFGVLGVFFNIKGKIGVSGSAKKRRYYFYFGKHSITTKLIKIDLKHTPVWTFTGTLGFNFLIFF